MTDARPYGMTAGYKPPHVLKDAQMSDTASEAYVPTALGQADLEKGVPKAKKKTAVAKPKRKAVRKAAPAKKRVKKPKAKKKVVKKRAEPATTLRPERCDLRLTKAEKAKLLAKARKTRRTVTSIMIELIEKMR